MSTAPDAADGPARSSGSRLTPTTSRTLRLAVVRADGSGVAFITRNGLTPTLYTVPATGGEPAQVPGYAVTQITLQDQLVSWN